LAFLVSAVRWHFPPILYVHRHYRLCTSYGAQSDSLNPFLHSHRNSHHPRHLRGSIRAGIILPPRAQPCQFSILKRSTMRQSPSLVLTYTIGSLAISAHRWFAEPIKQIASSTTVVLLRTCSWSSWSNSVMASTKCSSDPTR
jgi:hypothetical protein